MLRTLPKLKMLPTLAKLRILSKLRALNGPARVPADVRLHFERPDLRVVTSSDLVSVLQRRTLGPTRLMAVRKS
jgi:hypothetical protein